MDSESLCPITQVKPYLWIFNFASIAKLLSKMAVPSYTLTSNIWELLCSTSSPIFDINRAFSGGKGRVRVRIGFLWVLCYLFI